MKTLMQISREYAQHAREEENNVRAGELYEKSNRFADLANQDKIDLYDIKAVRKINGRILLFVNNELIGTLPFGINSNVETPDECPVIKFNDKTVIRFPFGDFDLTDILIQIQKK